MNFIYFSTLSWDEAGGAHNPTQMTLALARRGHAVLFVEPQPSQARESAGASLPIVIVALTELGVSLWQLKRAWHGLDSGDLEVVARELAARLDVHWSDAPRVAVYAAPFEPFVRLLPFLRAHGFSIVYYAMDDFAAASALGYTQFAPDAEAFLTQHADLCAAVSPPLARTLEVGTFRRNVPSVVIPNAINLDEWRRAPGSPRRALTRGELTLGFWGTIMDSMVDADLIVYTARARPTWALHLIGALDPEPQRIPLAAQLRAEKNIYLHPPVPHAQLPMYATQFDVCIAPFPNNAFTRARDPIKVYEYLAAHKPVVVSYAPQLAGRPYVFVASSPAEFVELIEHAARLRIDTTQLDAFLAKQNWDARAAMLLDSIAMLQPANEAIGSPAILPSFARSDGEALLNYATILERELTQIQAWARELEETVRAQERELERFRKFSPRRWWQRLVGQR